MGKILPLLLIFLTSCYREHLYVQMDKIDREFLASSHVDTPDPEQITPPEGKRLLVAWRFPSSWMNEGLRLHLTARFWDESEEEIDYAITKGHDYTTFDFLNRRLITYKVEIFDKNNCSIEVWEHQLWTKLIK
jgi:hypothetical protein